MNPLRLALLASLACGQLLTVSGAARGQEPRFDLEATLVRVGAQLVRRYQRSQRIVSTEMVRVQSFNHDMQSRGLPRQLEFERRVEWGTFGDDGVPTVTVFRELRSVNGREPTKRDLDACLTPPSEAQDPLSDLLPVRQVEFEFSLGELAWVDGLQVARLDYTPVEEGHAEVTWDEDCVSISLRGRSHGEAWVDVESGDVLRLDQHLTRRFEFREPVDRSPDRPRARPGWVVLERDDLSIRYEPVTFENPAETLMLPHVTEHTWVLKGSGWVPRYYRSQEFSNHRRFVTDGRSDWGAWRHGRASGSVTPISDTGIINRCVYAAHDDQPDRPVAIKMIRAAGADQRRVAAPSWVRAPRAGAEGRSWLAGDRAQVRRGRVRLLHLAHTRSVARRS